MIDRWACAWFPDLQRVESASDRWAVWGAAYKPVLRSWTYLLIALVVQVAGQALLTVPIARFARRHGLRGGLVEWGLPIFVALLACVVIVWLVRRRITRNLRQELATRGLPTCIKCGYNLTGNVSGRCPECGTER